MTEREEVNITTYDRLMRAWQNSTELVRDYRNYADSVKDENIKAMFEDFAEDEGMHATKLRSAILSYRSEK